MKQIFLTQDKIAIVDDVDYEKLLLFGSWYAIKQDDRFYACCKINKVVIKMHRLIMGVEDQNILVDHADRNGLNNQRSNLRIANKTQNGSNRKSRKCSSSKYLGVSWNKRDNVWYAHIRINKKLKHIGYYANENDAALAYNEMAKEIHGEFANLNIIL